MYSLVTVISVLLSLAVFIDVMMSLMCIYNSETNVECYQAIISRDPDHGFYSGVFFGAVTLGMMITAVPLCQAIRTLEKKSIVMGQLRDLAIPGYDEDVASMAVDKCDETTRIILQT